MSLRVTGIAYDFGLAKLMFRQNVVNDGGTSSKHLCVQILPHNFFS